MDTNTVTPTKGTMLEERLVHRSVVFGLAHADAVETLGSMAEDFDCVVAGTPMFVWVRDNCYALGRIGPRVKIFDSPPIDHLQICNLT